MKYKELYKSDIYDNKQITIEINNKYIRYSTEFLYELGRKEIELYDKNLYNGDVQRFISLKCNYEPIKTYNK